MKRRTLLGGGLSLAAISATGIMRPRAASAKTVNLRVASYAPAGNFVNDEIIAGFLDAVVADSEGTLAYQIFPGGTLGRNPTEQLRLVQDGVADIALILPSFTPGALDTYGVIEIPGLINDPYEGSIALGEALTAGLLPTPERTRMLGVFSTDVNILSLTAPVASLDELKSKRIRVVGRPQVEAIKFLGAVPTSGITSPETAEAINRGTVDGAVMGPGALVAYRVSEVVRQHIPLPMGAPTMMLPMNAASWDRLSEPAQAAFVKHGGEPFSKFAGEIFKRQAQHFLEQNLDMEGHSVLEIDDATMARFTEGTAPIADSFAARGPEFAAVLESMTASLERIRAQ
ncbi:MAG: TRAP transporter substrate-binding protein DctP [Paracoccus sp. (in: a-proteobacteria)]